MKSLTFVEVDVDYCSLTYGVAPCTASLVSSPPTGTIKCFNCRNTCQDIAHYDDDGATLRFAFNAAYLPDDIEAIPCVQSINFTPAIVSLDGDLGQRASIKITFKDEPHPDSGSGLDKYVAERSYNPFTQGTFWGRFRARHPFIQGKSLRVIRGLLGQALSEMETRHYVIESFEGPSYEGYFTITAKDILKLADGDRAQAPALSNGSILTAITDVDASLTLSPSGIGELEYPVSGYAALGGKEIVAFTRKYTVDLLYHFDGTNGATTSSDATGLASTDITGTNGAALSTTQKKFGTASWFLDGSNDYALSGSGAAAVWAFGTGEFVFDFWWWPVAFGGGSATIIDTRVTNTPDTGLALVMTSGGLVQVIYNNVAILQSGALTSGAFNHILVSRVGTTIRIFIGGAATGTTPSATFASSISCVSGGPRFGARYNNFAGTFANGYLDELRVVNGSGVSGTFTPPTSAYALARGDRMLLTRAQLGTEAQAHEDGDRVQLCLRYVAQDPADILSDLLQTYALVSADYVPLTAWQDETDSFYGSLLTATIAEPTSVNQLIAEILDIIAAAMWWDDRGQQIRFQVLRQIATDAARYSADNRMQDTLEISEQPTKRISQLWTYFAQINPLLNLDQLENYRSIAKTVDTDAEEDYEVPAIVKRYTRWIPEGGLSVASASNDRKIARFRDPPRKFAFDLFREYDVLQDPVLGAGYQLAGWPFQDATGAEEDVPIQITRLNPTAERYKIEAEEMRFSVADDSPLERIVIIADDTYDINLRTLHDALYAAAGSGDTVTCIINAGVKIGATSTAIKAFDVGSWASGVTVEIYLNGRIQGKGGDGGGGGVQSDILNPGAAGKNGGVAIYSRYAFTIYYGADAEVWGGAGGGAGGQGYTDSPGYPGGGGAGQLPGNNGATTEAGGPSTGSGSHQSGAGGGPGLAGSIAPGFTAGGSPGAAIDGVSYRTVGSGSADIRGSSIN